MDKETMTFTTARGASIPLEFYAKFHTKYPMLSGIDLSEIIKSDQRFQWISTQFRKINGFKIEYCQVKIMPESHCVYNDEQEYHQRYANKMCYLTVVSSDSEPIYDDDLEVNNPAFIRNGKRLRAVLIPEKL